MDPSQWNQYGRLAHNPGLPTTSAITVLLEQSGITSGGVVGSLPTLPTPSVHSTPRVATVTPYSHTLPGTLSQIIDTSGLNQTPGGQLQYKSFPVASTTLDQIVRSQGDTVIRSSSAMDSSKSVLYSQLFDTREVPSTIVPTSHVPSVDQSPQQRWTLPSLLQQTPSSVQEPPPAHGGLRNDPLKRHFVLMTQDEPAVNLNARSAIIRDPHHVHSQLTPQRALSAEVNRPVVQERYQEPSYQYKDTAVVSAVVSQGGYNSYTDSSHVHQQIKPVYHSNSAQMQPFSYANVTSPSKTFTQQSDHDGIRYEAVSPAPVSEPQVTYTRTLALHDLADISSCQEKMPLSNPLHQQHLLQHLSSIQAPPSSAPAPMGSHAPSGVPAQPDSASKRGRRSDKRPTGGRKRKDLPPEDSSPLLGLPFSETQAVPMSEAMINGFSAMNANVTFSVAHSSAAPYDCQMSVEQVAVEQRPPESTYLPSAYVNPNEILEHQGGTGVVEHARHPTKAMHKEMPPLVEEVDDEFAHLVALPAQEQEVAVQAEPRPPKPLRKSMASDFQGSFLSFLEGKKPESLASVTNSGPTKKPVLPKYVPDPRPRRPVESPTEATTDLYIGPSKEPTKPQQPKPDATKQNPKPKSSPMVSTQPKGITSSNVIRVGGLGAAQPGQDLSVSKLSSILLGAKQVKAPAVALGQTEKGAKVKVKGKAKVKKQEVVDLDVTPRERSSRKAKERVERKRQARKRPRSGQTGSGSDSGDFVAFSDNSDAEDAYDSDKDPGWNPKKNLGVVPNNSSGSEDEDGLRRPSAKKALKTPQSAAKKPRGRPKIVPFTDAQKPDSSALNSSNLLSWDFPDDYDPPHNYTRGSFVIERKELTNLTSFPIWRLESGRLLQKFEAFEENGKILHRSLTTYSSFSGNIRQNYKAIAARHVSANQLNDIFEVLPQYLPQPADDKLEEDELMPIFNVYLQTLVSQALEPGFMNAIQGASGDDYYSAPMRSLDQRLRDKQVQILEKVTWVDAFKKSLDTFPSMTISAVFNCPRLCQATDSQVPATFELIFRGSAYDPDTLQPKVGNKPETISLPTKFLIGRETVPLIKIYHRLQHFKYSLFKHCELQVSFVKIKIGKSDTHEVLDECLQNRIWAHMHFRALKELLSSDHGQS